MFHVSIHAPARGATYPLALHRYSHKFQSTHLREVRLATFWARPDAKGCFNPRTCARCDSMATGPNICFFRFNPRTCARCDRSTATHKGIKDKFQSTHLREVRQLSWPTFLLGIGFQSTHLREVRLHRLCVDNVFLNVSIHAPARGATLLCF